MSRILLAEPDPAVRRLMAAWLPRKGTPSGPPSRASNWS
jgi:hypothetical protein